MSAEIGRAAGEFPCTGRPTMESYILHVFIREDTEWARSLDWLERPADNREVESSNLFGPTYLDFRQFTSEAVLFALVPRFQGQG
jgi:hypothetical protein